VRINPSQIIFKLFLLHAILNYSSGERRYPGDNELLNDSNEQPGGPGKLPQRKLDLEGKPIFETVDIENNQAKGIKPT
jgi:hypothetical protein